MRDNFISLVNAEIDTLLKSQLKAAPTKEAKILIERVRELILRGGKRFRPYLLSLTYSAYGGRSNKKIVDLAVALELHHQFLLVHDDIIDQDNERNLGPNIVGYYQEDASDGNHIPQSMALLAGDWLFSLANLVILDSNNYSSELKTELLKLLNNYNKMTIYGEQLDVLNDPLGKVETVSALKTAAYTTRLPMMSAAKILSLSGDEITKIDKFALPFGILFQLVNDYSDYFDNQTVFNGPKYRDMRQGKITYPLSMALESATDSDGKFLNQLLNSKKNPSVQEIKKLQNIMDKTGATKKSQKLIESYLSDCYRAVDNLSISASSKQQFIKLIAGFKL